jgi:hypothetical protein
MASYWWWLIAGVTLILAEFVVPGVFICFFGVGAILTGIAAWLIPGMSFTAALLLFSILSVVFLFTCRRFMPKSFRGVIKVDHSDIENDDVAGAEVVVTEAITPGAPGKVEFRGSQWTARADRALAVGERAKIRCRRNITLYLE